MEKTHSGAKEMCEEKEEAAMSHYELTATPVPHPSCSVQGGEEVEESGAKVLKAMQTLAK